MSDISVSGLTVEYGIEGQPRYRALEDVSFEVRSGEFFCVVGASGCGKSTLVSAIAGFVPPKAGRVEVDGEAIRGPGPDRGVVFQEYALLPWRTVIDNVALGLKFRGVGRDERRRKAAEYLKLTGLEQAADKYPHELSGGMKQRTAVARTLVMSPKVMLMDEPFAAVDAQTRVVLQQELLRICAAQKMTVLFVTHSVEEAVFLGDRVMVLGRPPHQIKDMIAVDIPREERDWGTIATDPRFAALCGEVMSRVRGN
jgi:NitT/TauT family transport system ATP-binding protein